MPIIFFLILHTTCGDGFENWLKVVCISQILKNLSSVDDDCPGQLFMIYFSTASIWNE